MNVIAWLEFELAHYDSGVQRFNHYTTRTPPLKLLRLIMPMQKISWCNIIICRFITGFWFHTQRKKEENTSSIWSPKRDSYHYDDDLEKHESNGFFDIVIGICLDYILRTSIDLMKENGLSVKKTISRQYFTETITDANYAGFLALFANTPAKVKSLPHCLEQAASGIGLYIN